MAKTEKRVAVALERIADALEEISGKFSAATVKPAEEKPAKTKATSSSKKSAQTSTKTSKSSSTAQAASKKDTKATADSAKDTSSADGADGESSDDGPTQKDVKQALVSLQKAAGNPKQSIAILKKFGATTVPKLKPETYADVIEVAQKAEKKL